MALHVIPVDDSTVHDHSLGCPCEPYAEMVTRSDGSLRWAAVHRSVDPEDARLVEASARTPVEAGVSSSDSAEASSVEASTDEAEVR